MGIYYLEDDYDDGEDQGGIHGSGWDARPGWTFFRTIVNHGSADHVHSVFRFTGVTVAQGATISSAVLRIGLVGLDYPDASSAVRVFGDDVDNSGDLGSSHRPDSGWTNTTAYYDWYCYGLTGEQEIDVTAIVQEIVNRGGWSSGNAMSFFFDGYTSAGGDGYFKIRIDNSYDPATTAAELEITVSGGGSALVEVVDVGQSQSLETPSISEAASVSPADAAQTQALETPALTEAASVSPADAAQTQVIDSALMTEAAVLSPDSITQSQALDTPAVNLGADLFIPLLLRQRRTLIRH